MIHLLPRPTLFPYTTLFRSHETADAEDELRDRWQRFVTEQVVKNYFEARNDEHKKETQDAHRHRHHDDRIHHRREHLVDRKSTRLNSSHVSISYAVFCLKKK